MKKYAVVAALALALIAPSGKSVFFAYAQEEKAQDGLKLSGELQDGVRVIRVVASRYKFDPDPMVVKLGDKVRIITTTADDTHGFGLSAFSVNLIIRPGQEQNAEFVADKAGEFDVECTFYCGSGHAGMRAKFIVLK